MSSCTNSSNIRSTILTQIIREESDGRRVAFKINSADVGISAGVTLGSVVRYDATKDIYDLSKADNAATAEVIGIVEKIEGTLYTVVASGLMIYPDINSVINSYTGGCSASNGGTGGGDGGSDIFFLSDYCAGKLQLLEPVTPGHIVKPVMQRVKVGPTGSSQYNGIVLNYIGYEVSEVASSTAQMVGLVGDITYKSESAPPDGFIDARTEQILSVSDYPELYGVFGTEYGSYDETIKLDYTGNPTFVGLNYSQKNGSQVISSGTIISANSADKTITVRKFNNQPKTDLNKSVYVGSVPYTGISSSVTAFTVPYVNTQTITYKTATEEKTVTLIPYMRTKSNITSVSIPKKITISEITSDKVTTGGYIVGSKLLDLDTRVTNMETRYGII
jgi:hypothetical protein